MSTAPRKPKAKVQAAKAAPIKRPRKKPSRDIKDLVERSEAYTENVSPAVMDHTVLVNEGKQRAARLRQLLEPHNEAMIKVMVDIALNTDHKADPDKYPPIHASIRLEAADRVLLKLHGKPKETHSHEFDDGPADGDQVLGLLNNILTAIGAPLLELPDPNGFPVPVSEGSPTPEK